MTSSPAAAAVTGPCFATVTLVFADDAAAVLEPRSLTNAPTSTPGLTEPKTIRVPITPQTTVRELAKGAMARFMFSLRRSAKSSDLMARQLCRSGIVVTDVHLLGALHGPHTTAATADPVNREDRTFTAPRPLPSRIELFSDDCVMQVVQVREEVVFMHFKAAAEHTRKRKASEMDAASESAVPEPPKGVESQTRLPLPPPPPQSAEEKVRTAEAPPLPKNWSLMPAEHSVTTDDEMLCVSSTAEELSKGDISMSVPMPAMLQSANPGVPLSTASTVKEENEKGVLPAVSNVTRSNVARSLSGDDEDVNESTVEVQPEESEAEDADPDASLESSTSEDEKATENIARSIATLRQAETRRMPWGPDAYKHFAVNYVNSPQKIMTGRYNYKRLQQRQQQQQQQAQRVPPSVKLHQAKTELNTGVPVAATVTEKSATQNHAKEFMASLVAEMKPNASAPRKANGLEDVSSCDHSQVSVALSCGTNSPSTSPSKRATSDARSGACPPGPSTPSSPTAIASTAIISATAVAVMEATPKDVVNTEKTNAELADVKGEEQVCMTQLHKKPMLQNAVTPGNAILNTAASPEVPHTIAKPVQGLVARQLSFFEEESESATSRAATQGSARSEEPVQAVKVLSVLRFPPRLQKQPQNGVTL